MDRGKHSKSKTAESFMEDGESNDAACDTAASLPSNTNTPPDDDDMEDLGEIVYRCKVCGAEFAHQPDLRNHFKLLHGSGRLAATNTPKATPAVTQAATETVSLETVPLETVPLETVPLDTSVAADDTQLSEPTSQKVKSELETSQRAVADNSKELIGAEFVSGDVLLAVEVNEQEEGDLRDIYGGGDQVYEISQGGQIPVSERRIKQEPGDGKEEDDDEEDDNEENDGPVTCKTCDLKCSNRRALKLHQQRKHNFSMDIKGVIGEPRVFICYFCKRKYSWKKTLRKHIREAHNVQESVDEYILYSCELCHEQPFDAAELEDHRRKLHGIADPASAEGATTEDCLVYACNLCEKRYSTKNRFLNHIAQSHNAKWDQTDSQEVLLILSEYLRDSESVLQVSHVVGQHRGVVVFACGICDQQFMDKAKLRAHKAEVHGLGDEWEAEESGGPQAYACTVCGKKYRWKKTIRKHVKEQHMTQLLLLAKQQNLDLDATEVMEQEVAKAAQAGYSGDEAADTEEDVEMEEDAPASLTAMKVEQLEPDTDEAEMADESADEEQSTTEKADKQAKVVKVEIAGEEDDAEEEVESFSETETFKCRLCPREFTSRQQLKKHKALSHGSVAQLISPKKGRKEDMAKLESIEPRLADQLLLYEEADNLHPCQICHKKFSFLKGLRRHEQVAHDIVDGSPQPRQQLEYECDKCGLKCGYERSLRRHMLKMHQDYSIKVREGSATQEKNYAHACDECPRKFVWEKSLHMHMLKVHGNTNYAPKHKRKPTGIPPSYECDKCTPPRMFCREEALFKHYHQVHNLAEAQDIIPNTLLTEDFVFTGVIVYMCQTCQTLYGKEKDLRRHHKSEHAGEPEDSMVRVVDGASKSLKDRQVFYCSYCNRKFFRYDSCKNHEQIVHVGIAKEYQCTFCSRMFRSQAHLDRHVNLHHTKTITYPCPHCPKTFLAPEYVTTHVKGVHSEVQPWTCRVCHKGFCTVTRRNNHELIHNEIKGFQCQFCGKEFAVRSSVKIHENTVHLKNHITEYRCEACSKYYRTAERLAKHLCSRRLSGVCRYCSKVFTSLISCRRHEKLHTGIDMFECSVCDKKFTSKAHLKRHMTIHDKKRKEIMSIEFEYYADGGEEGFTIAEEDTSRYLETDGQYFEVVDGTISEEQVKQEIEYVFKEEEVQQ